MCIAYITMYCVLQCNKIYYIIVCVTLYSTNKVCAVHLLAVSYFPSSATRKVLSFHCNNDTSNANDKGITIS
jgi:hypothetical protein